MSDIEHEEIGGKTHYFHELCSHLEIISGDGVSVTLQWFFPDVYMVECNAYGELLSHWVTKASSLLTEANSSQFSVFFLHLESDHLHTL